MQGNSMLAVAEEGTTPVAAEDVPPPDGSSDPAGVATDRATPDAAAGHGRGGQSMSGWRLNVLGPVELCYDGEPVEVSGPTRILLALLARSPGEEIGTADIIAGMWSGEPPEDAEKEVASNVSRLRRALTVVAPNANPTSVVVTLRAGYILDIQPSNADTLAFERLTADGRRALTVGQPALAGSRLDAALALWRGPAYEDFGDHAFARAEAARLDELRMTAIESRIEVRLALAAPHAPAGLEDELRGLIAEHWYRERLWALLMTTLFRLGRRGEALAVCRQAQEQLARAPSAATGPDLRDAERAVIASDPALCGIVRDPFPVPAALSTTAPVCVGRGEEVGWLMSALDLAATRRAQARLVVGVPGIGKSRLMAEVAQHAAARGGVVRYWRGGVGGLETLVAESDRLNLVVLDDLDQAPHEDLATVSTFVRAAMSRPVVVLATCRDPVRVGDLQSVPKLVLSALDDEAVAEIVRVYAPATATTTAVAAMSNAGGVPARVHRAASEWSFHRAGRRIDRAVADAARPRAWLDRVESEVVGGVIDLAHVRDQARVLKRPSRAGVPCPYLGLNRFETTDADIFHGREQLVADLVARLVRSPFLAVVGAAATGKSSLVRAGLLPALASGVLPDSGLWHRVLITPSMVRGPLGEYLAVAAAVANAAVLASATAVAQPAALASATAVAEPAVGGSAPSDDESVAVVAGDVMTSPGGDADLQTLTPAPLETASTTLVVVDQFDEVFTLLGPAETDDFVSALVAAAALGPVVVTLRPDTLERCAGYPDLARLIGANSVLVTPMTARELRQAVLRPAAMAGVDVEAGLPERVVADAMQVPGDLASVSAALLGAWNRRSGRMVTLAGYEAAGRCTGAVSTFAEDVYGSLGPAEQQPAQPIMLRLARGPATIADVLTVAGPGGPATLELLAGRGLVRLTERVPMPAIPEPIASPGSNDVEAAAEDSDGYDGVELAHAVLASRWPRLRTWLADVDAEQTLRRHLGEAAMAWDTRSRPQSDVYRGARLVTTLDWASHRAGSLTPVEREFLHAGERVALAAENRRRRRVVRLWKWLAATLVVAVLAVAVATLAVVQQLRADAAARRADAALAAARATAEPDIRLALLLAVAAARLDPTGIDAVQAVLSRGPDLLAIRGEGVRALALSPDDGLVAAGTDAGGVSLLAPGSLEVSGRLVQEAHDPVNGLAFTTSGRQLVSWAGGPDRAGTASIVVWDVANRRPAGPPFGEAWPGPGGGLAADGTTLILAQHGGDATVALVAWSIEARTPSTAYQLPAGDVESVILSADGRHAVLSSAAGTIVVNLASGDTRAVTGLRRPLALSPDSSRLLAADGRDITVWDVDAGSRRGTATGTTGDITAAVWSGDGRVFASAATDGRITVWDAHSLRPLRVLSGNGVTAGVMAFAGDGATLYSAALGGPVIAWDLTGTRGAGATMPANADADQVIRTACALAGRDLSPDEWARFLPGRTYQHPCPD